MKIAISFFLNLAIQFNVEIFLYLWNALSKTKRFKLILILN